MEDYPKPISNLVNIMNTDLYQLTMCLAYYVQGLHEQHVTFDLFHRKCPFGGEYTIFAGLDQILAMLNSFEVTDDEISYLRRLLPSAPEDFWTWLRGLTTAGLTVSAPPMGTVVFPNTPIIRVEGPQALCQLLETPLLNLVNFPSLVATNASRFVSVFPKSQFLEFGLRRAQGPDGALSAARYAIMGGFNSTSNVLAGYKDQDLTIAGTMAHAFVLTFGDADTLRSNYVPICGDKDAVLADEFKNCNRHAGPSPLMQITDDVNFVARAKQYRDEYVKLVASTELKAQVDPNYSELIAFVAFAQIFPQNFLALIDTYDTLGSGLANFVGVACVLADAGWQPKGIRLDSGDLSYLSLTVRHILNVAAERLAKPALAKAVVVASNDINEKVLISLSQQGHAIDVFGVGTHLVTCQKQPALGCVYKLVQVGDNPRVKLSEDAVKVPVPAKKNLYRLYSEDGSPMVDLMTLAEERPPVAHESVLCLHPSLEMRCRVVPSKVESLLQVVFADQKPTNPPESLLAARERCLSQLSVLRRDHTRLLNPTPYKVSVTPKLAALRRDLILEVMPVKLLH